MAAETAAQQPVSAQVVGNAFVQQYYHILHHSPGLVYRFYQDVSKLGRPEHDGSMSITATMQAINDKIVSLNYDNYRAEIKSIDAQDSFQGGVQVLVTGYLTGKDNAPRNFAQTFFLAPQDKGYYVLNDMFRYLDIPNVNPPPLLNNHVVLPASAEPVPAPPQVQEEILVPQQGTPPAEEVTAGEVYNPPETEDIPIVQDDEDEEEPVAEVVDEVQDDTQVVVESNTKIEDAPKKSYASIVMHLKESTGSFSPPPAAARRAPPKNVEQVNPTLVPATDGQVSSAESVDDVNNQEGEDGHSVYIKGLPMTASESLLEEIFKQFGVIKIDGIQVRSNRQQGFCFGFVEYEEASSVQKAIEASPIAMGGRQVFIEEKRSTNSRGNNRGRFQPGRGSGFRSEGGRGRGNYGGGRGYNRGDFNGRSDFNNRGGHRGSSANRDGYQRSENFNNGGRVNRTGGIGNGSAKTAAPRVPATA